MGQVRTRKELGPEERAAGSLKDFDQNTTVAGDNILDLYTVNRNGQKVNLISIYKTYDWKSNNGYANFGNWIEAAAKIAGSI